MNPDDKATWNQEKVHMPWHRREEVRTFAPKVSYVPLFDVQAIAENMQAWAAIVDLLGGEERIDPESSSWGDSFIVNLGTPEWEGEEKYIDPRDLTNWHCDGDFFVSN